MLNVYNHYVQFFGFSISMNSRGAKRYLNFKFCPLGVIRKRRGTVKFFDTVRFCVKPYDFVIGPKLPILV